MAALGLGGHPAPDEIRAAWKRVAFRTHPDRNGGALDAFATARAAYDLLLADGPATVPGPAPVRPTRVSPARAERPQAPRVVEFSADVVTRCQATLDCEPGAERGATADHLPRAVRRQGRTLTYVVPTPLSAGINRVALPTAILEDPRKVGAKIVSFRSGSAGPSEFEIPDAMRAQLFPGARSVHIRFGKE